ncbi:S-adenosylmethionine:tRNA ribosyltransferase-isomerase [Salipaludibacillus aurantiacus]|uniref:S-adenosylmethionine:tRNA ribosyltransferase-isomerase n=1 Tax=Salipaludibacillus aurantiacus TaxID=1601833 RepID=A0A1H9Q978_9BACI|nr:S-adenosylmethionine:tRNA ribosyltransferase-isomerase [Salipaludibacillus aurantiacus]SER57061.1 S-adenosylmethionine:tRNA ribosyltransferase-isomerase [Salipaludibacillus aurantiacus]
MNTVMPPAFTVPERLNASSPPEARGLRRDFVKMMVLSRQSGSWIDTSFSQLPGFLREGDLLVLNNSRTIPAVFKADIERNGFICKRNQEVRLARRLSEKVWEVLVPELNLQKNDQMHFSSRLSAEVINFKPELPFTVVEFSAASARLFEELYSTGEPVRYEYIHHPWSLDYYQTVYANVPGSVEMPSAGRAFSWELLQKLQAAGIRTAFLQLHTGLSYLLDDRWHQHPSHNKEHYSIPAATLSAVKQTKKDGGRVVPVGTTVVRALETAARRKSNLSSISGWTDLYINEATPLRVADGLITGFHEPEASHLDMLSAFLNRNQLITAYQHALKKGYLWHEFGDINFII